VGAETLLQQYGVKVDPDEFRAFAGMGEAHFLRGVAGKHGVVIQDIDALKQIYYGIYLAKVAQSDESIGLPGVRCSPSLSCRQAVLHALSQRQEVHVHRRAARWHIAGAGRANRTVHACARQAARRVHSMQCVTIASGMRCLYRRGGAGEGVPAGRTEDSGGLQRRPHQGL
jgi:hypothetical protein